MSTPQNDLLDILRKQQQPQSGGLVLQGTPAVNLQPTEVVPVKGYGGAVVSALSTVGDVLSRGQYASARFFDGLADPSIGIFDLVAESLGEVISPKFRLSFSDVIKKRAPVFARENPKATAVLGFLGDVALDPTTYLGVGFAGKGIKIGGKVLTKTGVEALGGIRGVLANREVVTVAGGLFKDAEKDVIKAATKGITAQVEKISQGRLDKEIDILKKEYGEQLASLGIDITSKDFTGAALKELNTTVLGGDYDGVIRKLSVDEVRQTAEQRLSSLVEMAPELRDKIFKPNTGNIKLNVGVPFGPQKQFDIPGTEAIRALGLYPLQKSISFLDKLRETVIQGKYTPETVSNILEKSKGTGQALRYAFNRPMDEPYRAKVVTLQNEFNSLANSLEKTVVEMGRKVPVDRREVLGRVARNVDDQSSKFRFVNKRELTQAEADQIWKDELSKVSLNPDEMNVLARMQQDFKNAMELEMEAGLLSHGLANYIPRKYGINAEEVPANFITRYEAYIGDADTTSFISKRKYGLSTYLPSSKARHYVTSADAEAMGLVPELDILALYAQRMLSSRRALAINQFQESIKQIYGVPQNIEWASKEFVKGSAPDITNPGSIIKWDIPTHIIDDIKLLGESVYPQNMNGSTRSLLGFVDSITGVYRQVATVAKVSFAPKQLASNTFQTILAQGIRGAKAFDPRAFIDAAFLLQDNYRNKTTKLPAFFSNFFSEFLGTGEKGADAVLAERMMLSKVIGEEQLYDYAKDFTKRTTLGETYTGQDLIRVAQENGVMRGFDSLGNRFDKNLQQLMAYDPNNNWQVTKELAKWWKWPGMAEDYGRMTAFINYVGMGYSPKQAAEEVNKALFDYQYGLTSFEKNFVRRIVPFYTFQRFAIPFVLKNLMNQPGNIATGEKFVQLMERLLVSPEDTLNPSEREIFGDSLLVEQPHIYVGFDKTGQAKFNIFNNLTPLDVLSFFVYDRKTGQLDVERTAQKSVLAAITPFLKVPLEVAVDKNFFSGRTISDGGSLGDLSGGNLDFVMSSVLPDPVRRLIGWENRTNLVSGKTTTYINPYLAYYSFNALPALKQFVRPFDADKTNLEAAMEIIVGISPVKISPKEQRDWQELGETNKLRELQADIRTAKLRGSETLYDQRLREYQDYVATLTVARRKKHEDAVRGPGLGSQPTNPVNAEQEQK
jgi:hypothetical protein